MCGCTDRVFPCKHLGKTDVSHAFHDGLFRVTPMTLADCGPIVLAPAGCDNLFMSASERKRKETKSAQKPSHTCAICKRQFQPLQNASKETIYSICPDCRMGR